jgi:hypothetical protein
MILLWVGAVKSSEILSNGVSAIGKTEGNLIKKVGVRQKS